MELALPAAPDQLDVFFLLDTTSSMGDVICGLRTDVADIAAALADDGVDARFGVGEFRDYPKTKWSDDDIAAYKLGRPLGPLDAGFINALKALEANSGTSDGLTSALAAMYQTVTGSGHDLGQKGPSPGDIPPGLQAGFRPHALKVIVTFTDAKFRRSEDPDYKGYPGPSWSSVVRALTGKHVLQIGIDVEAGPSVPSGREDLIEMARDTGALAPYGGADCDDDGDADVATGAPLVCPVERPDELDPITGAPPPLVLAPAISDLLRALREQATVSMELSGPLDEDGNRSEVRVPSARLTPSRLSDVDLRTPQFLDFSLGLACGEGPSQSALYRLTARVWEQPVASATARLGCVAPEAAPAFTPPRAGSAATSPQPPSTNLSTQVHGQTQVTAETVAGTQVAPHANAAMAPVLQHEPALAKAFEDAGGYSMSDRRRSVPPAVPAAAAVIAGAALALRTRTRTRTAQAARRRA